MVKRSSFLILAIAIGVSCVFNDTYSRGGSGGGGGGGGGGGHVGSGHGGGMSHGGMSHAAIVPTARAVGSRPMIRPTTTTRPIAGTSVGTTATAHSVSAHAVGSRPMIRPTTVSGSTAGIRAGRTAAVGAVAGTAAGTAAARASAANRMAAARGRVPSNVVASTQHAQRIQGTKGEAASINRQASGIRAPRGGNTTRQQGPQRFGRNNYAFFRNGHSHIVSFRGRTPFLWRNGWWYPWPLFWSWWPWWYWYGSDYGYDGYDYDDCYDCDFYDCPDYCYEY